MQIQKLDFIRIFRLITLALVLSLVFSQIFTNTSQAAIGINRQINFQGKLVNNPLSTNVANTNYTVVFTFYDRESGGTVLWQETQTVSTTDGIFRVALGSVTPFPSNFNFNWDGLYLGIEVNAPINDPEMTPRIRMAAVPFAFNSEKVAGLTVQDTAGNASTSGTLQVGNGKTISFADNISFGTGTTGLISLGSGSNTLTLATTGNTSLTLPQSGTLCTTASCALSNWFNQLAGALVPLDTTNDFLLGSTATSSALFSYTGIKTGNTIASVSGTLNVFANNGYGGNASLSGKLTLGAFSDATIQSTSNQLLTVGGNTTGQVVLSGYNGAVNGITFSGYNSCTLKTNASGVVTCGTDNSGSGVNWWNQLAGALSPVDITNDFLLGGNATSAAKFSYTGIQSGNTIASVSGSLIVMPNNGYGQVGIGTTTPGYRLHLSGGDFRSEGTFRTGASGEPGRWRFFDSSGYLMSFWDAGTDWDTWGLNWDTTVNQMQWMGNGALASSIDLDNGDFVITGTLSDSNSNLILDDTVDLFSTTTGLRVGTDGDLSDIDDAAIVISDGLTVSGAIGANGGITFDQATDTLGAFTMAGSIIGGSFIITDIGSTGTDFDTSGGLSITTDAAGTALTVDNAANASSIFVAEDNNSPVFTIADGGNITMTGTLAVNGDSITSDGTLVINSTTATDIQDGLTVDSLTIDTGDITWSGTTPTITINAAETFTISNGTAADNFIYNTSTNALTIGDGTNGLTFDIDTGMTYQGSGRKVKKITLNAEYPGAILTASGSATTNGSMTSDASPSAALSNWRTYYEWSSSQTTLQDYTVAVRVKLPEDFSAWDLTNAITISYNTELPGNGSNKMDVVIYNSSTSLSAQEQSTPVVIRTANISASAKTWLDLSIDDSDLTDNGNALNTAGNTAIIYINMYSKDDNHVQIGDITLSYLSAF